MTASLEDLLGEPAQPTEFERVLQLPQYEPDDIEHIQDTWTIGTCRVTGSHTRVDVRLRDVQALALHHAHLFGGVLGDIRVGQGKTLVSLLAHLAFDVPGDRVLLILPARMRKPLATEARKFLPHFEINTELHVASYAELSQPDSGPTLLEDIGPLVVICDEAHYLKDPRSARTQRIIEYAADNPQVRWVFMSGTLTTRSVRDFAHLSEIALRENSPVPRSWDGIEDVSICCDVERPDAQPAPWQWGTAERLVRAFHPEADHLPPLMSMKVTRRRQICREALYERLRTTPGFVQTRTEDLGVTLSIQPRTPQIPVKIEQMMAKVQRTYCLPSGEEIDSPLELWRCLRQLSCGFYYVWDWPGGVVDKTWLKARARRRKAIRIVCQRHGLQSPALTLRRLQELIEEEDTKTLARSEWAELAAAEAVWQRDHAHKPQPPTKPVWFSDWFIEYVVSIAEGTKTQENAILWYEHQAVADRLAEPDIPITVVYARDQPPTREQALPVACSIRSHGTGQNLQGWGRALVLTPPANGAAWEQLLGRLHRQGQKRDEVTYEVMLHSGAFAGAISKAKKDAEYIQTTTGQQQRLLYANWLEAEG